MQKQKIHVRDRLAFNNLHRSDRELCSLLLELGKHPTKRLERRANALPLVSSI